MPRQRKYSDEEQHARNREAARRYQQSVRSQGRDIHPLPEIVDLQRRDSCRDSLQRFCEIYFGELFTMSWSDDHLRVLSKAEQAITVGGLFALAMPRGSGKTTIAECAALWAVLYGHSRFLVLIGADRDSAAIMLESLKSHLESNDMLFDDFPEVCYPIRQLEGIPHRCNGQTYQGKRTHISWTADEIVFPMCGDWPACGNLVRVAGITGRIRGMKHVRPDGASVRPDLVIVDDPQTDESARSPSQSAKRESILAGAILGLAGPGKAIAGIMPCTVIAPGDMADAILNTERHPEWNGERTKMIYEFPSNERLWEDYQRIRAESLQADGTITKATEFYREHQAEMDEGAVVAWKDRYRPHEVSALQHAMELKYRDERTFWAEYQNDPAAGHSPEDIDLTASDICAKINGLDRLLVPIDARTVTAYIDVQQKVLFYTVIAWADQFTGWVIDYGAWPKQTAHYYTLGDIRRTMATVLPGAGLEAQIYNALAKLCDELMQRSWTRDDDTSTQIQRLLIDANWGQSTDIVHQYCRQSPYHDRIMPAHGRYVGAGTKPMNAVDKKPGEIRGHNWSIPPVGRGRSVRAVLYDTNYWKTHIMQRLALRLGDTGCLSLWGRSHAEHRLYADHMTAEYRIRTHGRGRVVDEWKIRPERGDNHWFDCTVGCAVAAAMSGITMREWVPKEAPQQRRRKRKRGVIQR